MNKKMIFRLLFIFIFSLLVYLVFGFNVDNGDGFANFGFSYGLIKGGIPYLDFNTISTPLYMFYQAIFLLISNQYIMFIIGQSILVTIMFYFLFKEFDKKAYYVLISMISLKFCGFASTYNYMCLFWFVILMYLENKHNNKDFLIGFVIALCSLSKHTVGLLFVLPTFFFYYKDFKKILKRAVGFIIPWLIFIIYLVINKALFRFIDLCFLGLLDFGNSNGNHISIWLGLSIILFIISIYYFIKNKNIRNLYFVFTISFAIPIFDLPHFILYLVCFIMMLLPSFKEVNKNKIILIVGLFLELTIFNVAMLLRDYSISYYDKQHHLFGKVDYVVNTNYNQNINNTYLKHKDKNPIVLAYSKMYVDIVNDRKIDYYNVFMYGNYGYDGNNKEINKIKKMHNQYFLIAKNEYLKKEKYDQFNNTIAKYVIDNSKLIEESDYMWLYYKE